MLAMIIIMTFYVIYNIYCYLIFTITLWEWVCWVPHFIDANWSTERLIQVPKAGQREWRNKNSSPKSFDLKLCAFSPFLFKTRGIVKIEGAKKEVNNLKCIVIMLFVQIRPTKSNMLCSEGDWRLSQMSKHFPVNITILDTGHFINFNIHFCSTAVWYSCGIYSPSMRVISWKRGGIKILILLWHGIYSYFIHRLAVIF